MNDVGVVLVAGGRGLRFGGDVPKQFQLLGGTPMLAVTARRFLATQALRQIVVVAAPGEFARCEAVMEPLGVTFALAPAGAERQQSVASGLAALDPACTIVVVHDAVRPLVTPAAIAATIAAARSGGAAILAVPASDTVKRVRDTSIVETVPRADLWLAQTPQVFDADLLRRAHAAADASRPATDDAALVERLGHAVSIVPGDPANRKITTPEDLAWAEAVLARAG